MPEAPDVGAIVKQVKARIKQIEAQLNQRDKLMDELGRLRGALSRLEGAARTRARPARRGRPTVTDATGSATDAQPAPKRANAPARAPRGQNKAKVLEALDGGPMTASEVAKVTGIATGTVSTLLTKLAKTGDVTKADRGYKLPN